MCSPLWNGHIPCRTYDIWVPIKYWVVMRKRRSILIKHESCLSVCLSTFFLSHQKSQLHDILAQGVIWANLKHHDAQFFNFSFFMDPRCIFRVFFAFTNLYHYDFCSPFPQSSYVIASWHFYSGPIFIFTDFGVFV